MDSLAAVGSRTLVAGASEALIARMSRDQVAVSRRSAAPAMLATGRPRGMWRDRVLGRSAPGDPVAAFVGFRVPVYAAILWLAGAAGVQMAAALGSATVLLALLSRPCGPWLDRLRRACGGAPGAAARG